MLLSYTPTTSYRFVLISCPEIENGENYYLTAGGSELSVNMTAIIYGSGRGMGCFIGGRRPDHRGRKQK